MPSPFPGMDPYLEARCGRIPSNAGQRHPRSAYDAAAIQVRGSAGQARCPGDVDLAIVGLDEPR